MKLLKVIKTHFEHFYFENLEVISFKKVCNIINQFKNSNEMDSLGKEREKKINYLYFLIFIHFFKN